MVLELPGQIQAGESVEDWAWKAIKGGLAAADASGEGADDEDEDDVLSPAVQRAASSRRLMRRICSRGPELLKRFELEVSKGRAELASMEAARKKANEEARCEGSTDGPWQTGREEGARALASSLGLEGADCPLLLASGVATTRPARP